MEPVQLLFEEIKDALALKKFIERPEDLYLEYKTKADSTSADVDRNLRENIQEACSGFSNSDGGLLVIGVSARKGEPRAIKPVSLGPQFLENVIAEFSQATAPPIIRPSTKLIEIPGEGYVLILLIRKSEEGPHMNMIEKVYNYRVGDQFRKMEHYQIADMFGRIQRPHLIPGATLKSDPNEVLGFDIVLSLRNSGRAVARIPYIDHLVPRPWRRNNMRSNLIVGLARSPSKPGTFIGNNDDVIHPGLSLDVTTLSGFFDGALHPGTQLEIRGRVAAENFILRNFQIVIPGDKIMQVTAKGAREEIYIPGTLGDLQR